MSVVGRELVGRGEELRAIADVFDGREWLPGAALLAGEAGIGKTALWLAAIDTARDRGFRVLSCRPAEAEARSSFVSLADLLSGSAAEVLPGLPPIQRRALEGALLLGEAETRADDRAVGSAFLGALRLLAAERPVCLAADDIQWLDAASLAALRFALARLEDLSVAVVLAVRGDVPSWVRRVVPAERQTTIAVGALSVGAIRELLQGSLGVRFPRPTLIRIWETSGGNPLFALELAAALQHRGGLLAAGEELPIPSDLDELLRARIEGLAPQTSKPSGSWRRSATRPRASSKELSAVSSRRGSRARCTPECSSSTATGCASRIPCCDPPSSRVRHHHGAGCSTPVLRRS